MPGHANRSRSSGQDERIVRIFIDNSNLWIQGQKTSAVAKGLEDKIDPLWRFDVGNLKAVLTRQFRSPVYTDKYEVKLYGSTPPPVDTVWAAIRSEDVQVNTFSRSKWTGSEKQVDAQLIADATDRAVEDYYTDKDSVYVIVSGDLDLLPAVNKIVDRGFPVHIWSWKNCMAGELRRRASDLIQIHELDEHLEEIGFRECAFRLDRDIIDPNSIVVLDPTTQVDVIEAFCANLGIFVFRYEQMRDDGSGQSDLVIIPCCAKQMGAQDWEDFILHAKDELQAHQLTVLTHREYRQRHLKHNKDDQLAISNQFAELQMPRTDEDEVVGDKRSVHEQGDGSTAEASFIMVNKASQKQRERLKRKETKSHKRCMYGRYCGMLPDCAWGHSIDERNNARLYGTTRATKIKLCSKDRCMHKSCKFAHSESELRCPTCDRVGVGHKLGECPELHRSVV